jgi:hypothetical protein
MKKLTIIASVILTGCIHSPDIQDQKINDRVKACGAGFSEALQLALNASLSKANLNGSAKSDFKEETKATIFAQMPEGDKLKSYEDYIGCIEKNWNGSN